MAFARGPLLLGLQVLNAWFFATVAVIALLGLRLATAGRNQDTPPKSGHHGNSEEAAEHRAAKPTPAYGLGRRHAATERRDGRKALVKP